MSKVIEHPEVEVAIFEEESPESEFTDEGRVAAIFDMRAERLARRRDGAIDASPRLPVLVFYLGEERYALELTALAETLRFDGCTSVPGAPPEFLGVINIRGRIRSVVDLARLLKLDRESAGHDGCLLVLRERGREIGLRVDRIEGTRVVLQNELIGLDPASGRVTGGCARGVTSDLVVVLDSGELLESIDK